MRRILSDFEAKLDTIIDAIKTSAAALVKVQASFEVGAESDVAKVVCSIFGVSVAAGTPMLSDDILVEGDPRVRFWRVYACFQANGNLSVRRNRLAAVTNEVLNAASGAMVANGAYMFTIPVVVGDSINFSFSAPTACTIMEVYEIPKVTS